MYQPNCRRPLNSTVLAEGFVDIVFGVDLAKNPKIVHKIVSAEANLINVEHQQTMTHEDFRVRGCRSDEQRECLRRKVLYSLIHYQRLPDDDKITFQRGGAKPASLCCGACAYIVSGAPASGKSGIAAQLADQTGAYILDSDYAKRKLPEYSSNPAGASLVHEESDYLTFNETDSLWEYCIYKRANIVIPLVGKSYQSVNKICTQLKSADYKIHIINVSLDRYECTRRAYRRYETTKRYVPLAYVFDEVGNAPELVYFQLKRTYQNDSSFLSFSQLSTDVSKGAPPQVLEATENSPYYSDTQYKREKEADIYGALHR